jgi:DNA-binding NtrC family response regulator
MAKMAEQLKKYVIACVDDDEAMLAAVSRCLRREASFDVRTTTNPHEMLAWIAAGQVAVLVSDYEMPEMTGAQLAGQAKRIYPETVRILLTGKRTLETAVDGINQGEVFRFINKPFEDRMLRQCVAEAVQRHEELIALSGDRQRRERRDAMRSALEAEYPGISEPRRPGASIEVPEDPWAEASAIGLVGLDRKLESGR